MSELVKRLREIARAMCADGIMQYSSVNKAADRIEELEAQVTEHRSQLKDIRNAALPDPYDERDMSVEWLQALIRRVTPPPEDKINA